MKTYAELVEEFKNSTKDMTDEDWAADLAKYGMKFNKPTPKIQAAMTEYDDKVWPKQRSGNRFEWRNLGDKFQVYGEGLRHVCECESEEMAAMVCDALNKFVP